MATLDDSPEQRSRSCRSQPSSCRRGLSSRLCAPVGCLTPRSISSSTTCRHFARAGRERRADASPGRRAALADHWFRCVERPRGVIAPHRRDHRALCPQISTAWRNSSNRPTETRDVDIATITGVGSSALGSAALAWDVSSRSKSRCWQSCRAMASLTSPAGTRRLVCLRAHDFLGSRHNPDRACDGCSGDRAHRAEALPHRPPNRRPRPRRADFSLRLGLIGRASCPAQHRATPFRLLVGHSKGALQINNAIQSLPAERTRGLRVVTLGCPIAENVAGVDYHQYLGLFDALGQLNAWGHWPEHWPPTWHSTNPVLPPAMAAGEIPPSRRMTDAEQRSIGYARQYGVAICTCSAINLSNSRARERCK